jgi:hypothetical protein
MNFSVFRIVVDGDALVMGQMSDGPSDIFRQLGGFFVKMGF